MAFEVGQIVEGKVTGIVGYGAFVDIGDGVSGMVHISEIASTYVNDIRDHLEIGQQVKVLVLDVHEDGKIALSIKRALPDYQQRGNNGGRGDNRRGGGRRPDYRGGDRSRGGKSGGKSADDDFDTMLSKYLADSNENYRERNGGEVNRRGHRNGGNNNKYGGNKYGGN